jgi:hypothetical protein
MHVAIYRIRKLIQFITFTFGLFALFWFYLNRHVVVQQLPTANLNSVNVQHDQQDNRHKTTNCKHDGNSTIWSHPLQNDCRYATLTPTEPDIQPYVQQLRTLACKKVQDELRFVFVTPSVCLGPFLQRHMCTNV